MVKLDIGKSSRGKSSRGKSSRGNSSRGKSFGNKSFRASLSSPSVQVRYHLPRHAGRGRLRIAPHRKTRLGHIILGLADGILAEVKDRCRQHRRGVTVADAFDEMVKISDPAGGDHRHRDGVGNGPG